MTAIVRATLGRLLPRRPRRPERTWYVGEPVLVAACDRSTGRPERPAVSFDAVVTNVDPVHVTIVAGRGANKCAYDFYADGGWDAWPSEVTPWRIFHQAERWRL
jgi:hypothetical protein